MTTLMTPRFKNGDLVPNEELDAYPQTQEMILASLTDSLRDLEIAETKRIKKRKVDESTLRVK